MGHEMIPQNGGYANENGYTNSNGYSTNGHTGYTEPAVNGVHYGEGATRPVVAQNY